MMSPLSPVTAEADPLCKEAAGRCLKLAVFRYRSPTFVGSLYGGQPREKVLTDLPECLESFL